MKVGKIGHASLVISTPEINCFSDPCFVDPYAAGSIKRDPPMAIDAVAATEACDVIVLSHEHRDHFDVTTLAMLNRECPVFYPRGCKLLEKVLTRLHYKNITAVGFGEKVKIADLTIYPTASEAPWIEVGFLFENAGHTFWNMVDSVPTEATIAFVKKVVGRIDLLFANYEPAVEEELYWNALGSGFPINVYSRCLRDALDVKPRCLVPGSCGVVYVHYDWLNDRGFPVHEEQFVEDINRVDPTIKTLILPPGDTIEVGGNFEITPGGVGYARRLSDKTASPYAFRPDRGVPALVDVNPRKHPIAELKRRVTEFLDGAYLPQLSEHVAWLERMHRLAVVWRLEVMFPDGTSEVRHVDFRQTPAVWAPADATYYPRLRTAIAASTIVGLLLHEIDDSNSLKGSIRVASMLYEPFRGGAQLVERMGDEPLGRVLCRDADDHFIEHELKALGY